MPLIKQSSDEDMTVWRYWCACTYPLHVLELIDYHDINGLLEVSICIPQQRGIWRRIKEATKILFGKDVHWTEVVIIQEDRDEIAAVLKKEVIK